MTVSRRDLLTALPAAGVALAGLSAARAAVPGAESIRERFFNLDSDWAALNNALATPCSTPVQEALARYREQGYARPSKRLWNKLVSEDFVALRERLAAVLGVDPAGVALVRNTTEGMAHALLGYPMKSGDEILQTSLEFPGMSKMLERRAAREGVIVKTAPLPSPHPGDDDILQAIEDNITPKTRALLVSPVPYLTGQMLPIRRIIELAHAHDIAVISDGAQSFAHLPDGGPQGADLYATSLHKWLGAPQGTGVFYCRPDLTARISEAYPTYEFAGDSALKFEQFGTFDGASFLAVNDALDFQDRLFTAVENKAALLRGLTNYWWSGLKDLDGIALLSDIGSGRCAGIASFTIEGIGPAALADWLWQRKIDTRGYESQRFAGNRVSVNIFTSKPELDRLVNAIRDFVKIQRG